MKYRSKSVTIEAFRIEAHGVVPRWFLDAAAEERVRPANADCDHRWGMMRAADDIEVKTNHGWATAEPGDWIIRTEEGELYPCKPDVFAARYGRVGDVEEAPEIAVDPALAPERAQVGGWATMADGTIKGWKEEFVRAGIADRDRALMHALHSAGVGLLDLIDRNMPGWHDALDSAGRMRRAIAEVRDERPFDIGRTSDGYHTFHELYEHRHALFLALASAMPEKAWAAREHHDGTKIEGWFVAGILLDLGEGVPDKTDPLGQRPERQITYHLPDRLWKRVEALGIAVDRAPAFDGHTPEDVLLRLTIWGSKVHSYVLRENLVGKMYTALVDIRDMGRAGDIQSAESARAQKALDDLKELNTRGAEAADSETRDA